MTISSRLEEIMALSSCNTEINKQKKEIIEHGTGLFPIACYYDDLIKQSVPWHWHDEMEAAIVVEGSAIIAAGEKKYIINKGEGIFINGGILHASWNNNSSICRLHSLTFHPRLIGGSIDSIFWQNYIEPLLTNPLLKGVYFDYSEPWHKKAIDSIECAWQNCYSEPFGYEFEVRHALSELILQILIHKPSAYKKTSEKALRNSSRIKLMLNFIQEHYSEQLTVTMIADSAMISESECLRCFKNVIGIPRLNI